MKGVDKQPHLCYNTSTVKEVVKLIDPRPPPASLILIILIIIIIIDLFIIRVFLEAVLPLKIDFSTKFSFQKFFL